MRVGTRGLLSTRRSLVAGLVTCALAALLGVRPAWGEAGAGEPDTDPKEYQVKAAFLTHFIKYTTWPKSAFESKDSPFVLLVVGDDPFGAHIDKVMEKVRGAGRPVRVLRAKDTEDLPSAHMIFLAKSHAKELGAVLAGSAKTATLIVGDTEGLAADGAHINLFLDKNRLGFEVNTDAVKRSKLSISSEMLKLARIVKDRKEHEQ